MDGKTPIAKLAAYLSRLTGEAVMTDQPLALRSVHRAALAAWVRNERLVVRSALISSGAPFSIDQLLAPDGASAPTESPRAAPTIDAPSRFGSGPSMSVGIDIEDIDKLPEAEDYREHPFFRDNFTPTEIAYCIMQPSSRASFCGLWAAKEAILKSGAASTPSARLGTIEIVHDAHGRPRHADCQLSISHTERSAIAVCIVSSPAATASSPAPIPPKPTVVPAVHSPTVRRRLEVFFAACAIVILMAAFSYMVLHA